MFFSRSVTMSPVTSTAWTGPSRRTPSEQDRSVGPGHSRRSGSVEVKRKAKLGFRKKPKLDNARKLHSISFIDPADEEFKDVVKNARRKLEVPMPDAMLCKTRREEYKETCRIT